LIEVTDSASSALETPASALIIRAMPSPVLIKEADKPSMLFSVRVNPVSVLLLLSMSKLTGLMVFWVPSETVFAPSKVLVLVFVSKLI
jgi:hypothetical protein